MCEALVCIRNMGQSGDPLIDSCAPKRGDVVTVQEDGWNWGTCELGQIVQGNPNGNHAFFRIFKFPNTSVAQAAKMLSAEKDTDPQNPSPYLQYRAFFFDVTKIPSGALQIYWNDDARSASFISLPYSAVQMNTIVTGTDDVGCPAFHARIAI